MSTENKKNHSIDLHMSGGFTQQDKWFSSPVVLRTWVNKVSIYLSIRREALCISKAIWGHRQSAALFLAYVYQAMFGLANYGVTRRCFCFAVGGGCKAVLSGVPALDNWPWPRYSVAQSCMNPAWKVIETKGKCWLLWPATWEGRCFHWNLGSFLCFSNSIRNVGNCEVHKQDQ